MSKRKSIKQLFKEADAMWECYGGEMIVKEGLGIRAYVSDGVSVFPCGEMVDEEFEGKPDCSCDLCKALQYYSNRKMLFKFLASG